jgi:serine/threonine protein kinase
MQDIVKVRFQKPALYSKPGSITSMMDAIATNFDVSALAGRLTLHACIGIVHQLLLALQSLHKDDLEGFHIDMQHILLCTGSHRWGPVIAFLPSKLSWQLSHFKDGHIVTCGGKGGERTTAPEVLAGGARNRASDLFAVGCVYFMLVSCGEPQWDDTSCIVSFPQFAELLASKLDAMAAPTALLHANLTHPDPAERKSVAELLIEFSGSLW